MIFEPPKYLKEIEDADWVQEIIMERFDNALELMTPDSIVYGGAVRDCLAGKDLVGDLDFAVTRKGFHVMSDSFHRNSKWVPHNTIMPPTPDRPFRIKSSGDIARKHAPMSQVSSFKTLGDKVVQLVTTKSDSGDLAEDTIYVARMVDIVCCGVFMRHDGRIFEAIPGAYQDCLDGVLRINDSSDTIFLEALPERVNKLVSRGWKNLINVKKVAADVKKKREREKRKVQSARATLHKKLRTSKDFDKGTISHDTFCYDPNNEDVLVGGGNSTHLDPDEVEKIFSDQRECVSFIHDVARKFELNVRVTSTPLGSIHYETSNGHGTGIITKEIYALKRDYALGKRYKAVPKTKKHKNPASTWATRSSKTTKAFAHKWASPEEEVVYVKHEPLRREKFHGYTGLDTKDRAAEPQPAPKVVSATSTSSKITSFDVRIASSNSPVVRIGLPEHEASQFFADWQSRPEEERLSMLTEVMSRESCVTTKLAEEDNNE